MATTDVDVWVLDRDAFLLAATPSTQAIADAEARMDEVLAGDRGPV